MTATIANGRLTAAIQYRDYGWSVLALCPPDHSGMSAKHREKCESPGKAPWHKWKQFQAEHVGEDELHRWFEDHPASNIGIALGPVSGLVRIDVDGPAGRKYLAEMSGDEIPETLRFASGGGGEGLLFSIPPGVELRTTRDKGEEVHDEIRFQGAGAQTVLPPSLHPSGQAYRWLPG